MAKNKPVHRIPARGSIKGINAAVFEHTNGNNTWYNATVTKSYQDKDGAWQESDSYGRDDCFIASKLYDMAFAWICEQERLADSNKTKE